MLFAVVFEAVPIEATAAIVPHMPYPSNRNWRGRGPRPPNGIHLFGRVSTTARWPASSSATATCVRR